MGLDDGRIHGIDASDASTFLRLVEDDIDCADQAICEVKRRNVFGESAEFLEVVDDRSQSIEEGFDMSVYEPTHARAAALSLLVHEAYEFGILRDEMNMGADARANRGNRIVALGSISGLERGGVESASDLAERLVDGGLPKLEFAAEVVAKEAERYVRPACDLACRRSVEALFRKRLLRRIEDPLAHLGRAL
jgi:hypothetical protein